MKWLGRFLLLFVPTVAALAIVLLLLWKLPAVILANDITSPLRPMERAEVLRGTRQLMLWMLGGGIAIVTLFLSFRREKTNREALKFEIKKEATRRDEADDAKVIAQERSLRERFVILAELLAHSAASTRQAAFYALGALADDWAALKRSDEVQVCIDTITGYLRSPLPNGQTSTPAEEIGVRQAAYAVIASHLAKGPHLWSDKDINLSNTIIDFPVSFDGTQIIGAGHISFNGSSISGNGRVSIEDASIDAYGKVSFEGAQLISGGEISFASSSFSNHTRVSFRDTVIQGGTISFAEVNVSDEATVSFASSNISALSEIWFGDLRMSNRAEILFTRSQVSDSTIGFIQAGLDHRSHINFTRAEVGRNAHIAFELARLDESSVLTFNQAKVSDLGRVTLEGSTISSGSAVFFNRARVLAGGSISLDAATFNDSKASFRGARLSSKNSVTLYGAKTDNLTGNIMSDDEWILDPPK